ncbi:MAG: hypothetical protein KKF65_06465, partial [Nanoarchaeota archaeon]|nr:hypothetical protein [Nanoarchaeota archaeon]
MRTKFLIIPILFFLAVYSVFGTSFYVNSEAVKKDIFISEVAKFNISITNVLETSDIYTLSVQDPSWIILTQQVQISSESTKSFILEIYPTSNVLLGVHAVNVKIKSSKTGEFKQELLVINIRPYDPIFGEYRPSIQFSATIDKEVDPRKRVPVSIYMRNRNALDVGAVTIEIDGTLFSDTITTYLGPMEEKRTEYLFDIDKLEKPDLYMLDVQIKVKNITISRATQNWEVIGYSTITMDRREESFLCKKKEIISLENLGNIEKTKQVNLVMPWTKRMFTTSELEFEVVRVQGKSSLQWDVTLESQEFKEIIVTTNY